MKILVTGATGFVGHHVAAEFQARGAHLRLLHREGSCLANLVGLEGERFLGDLTRPETLVPALKGCDAVAHVAADYRLWIPDPEAMLKANVEGTRALLALAKDAGVKRVVCTSSVATMGFFGDGRLSDEDTPVALKDMVGHYKRSKFLAERAALDAAEAGQDVVVLNPTTPVGSHDLKPTPTGRIIVDFLRGAFPAYMDTGLNLVDVREVARLHAEALEHARPGRRYILGGENLTLKQILDLLAELSGVPSPKLRIPHWAAYAYAAFEQTFTGRLLGREPRATTEEVRMGRKKMWVSSARAQNELGLRPTAVREALAQAVAWFRSRGPAVRGLRGCP